MIGDTPTLTVGQLIEALKKIDPSTPCFALWDTIDSFEVHGVFMGEHGLIIDCESGRWPSKPKVDYLVAANGAYFSG